MMSEQEQDSLLTVSPKTQNQLKTFKAATILLSVTVIVLAAVLGSTIHDNSNNGTTTCAFETCVHPPAQGTHGAVSTTNLYATEAGLEMLQNGGNAFDAAAAIQFMLNVVQPQSTGIGGGCFIVMYHAQDNRLDALDGREEAPARFNATSFCANPDCLFNANCSCANGAWNFSDRDTGGHPVGVPGVLAAVQRMLDEYGTRTMAQVMQPAIDRAKTGFPMYQDMFDRINAQRARLALFPSSVQLFLPNNGTPPAVGSVWSNPDLAATFELIARNGSSVFYSGELADEIINTVQNARNPTTGLFGVMEKTDLLSYRAVYREAVNCSYRGRYVVAGMNMPSSGGLSLCMMLNLLELFELKSMTPQDGEFLHRLVAAQDIVFADRNLYMADADFVDVPVMPLIQKQYAQRRADNYMSGVQSPLRVANGTVPPGVPFTSSASSSSFIRNYGYDEATTTPSSLPSFDDNSLQSIRDRKPGVYWAYASSPNNERHGTTHMCIIDQWRNIVSMTTTIEENMGSAVVVPGRGFLLNNELTDFTGTPNDPATGLPYANAPEGGKKLRRTALGNDATTYGGKRPMSSMTPTIVFINTSSISASQLLQPSSTDLSTDSPAASCSDLRYLPYLAIGSPGGSRIIGQVLNALVNFLDYDMCISDAIAAPRAIARNDGVTEVELPLLSNTVAIDLLNNRGFNVQQLITDRPLGYVQGANMDWLLSDQDQNPFQCDSSLDAAADSTRLRSALALAY